MRLGIFGGTFDPPHLGHLILAQEALWQLQLERIFWLLTPVSPLKSPASISPLEQRMALLETALGDNPDFEISRLDIERPGPHYAFESMKQFKENFPQEQLVYLIGRDSLQDLPRWKNPLDLIKFSDQIGVMDRPGEAVVLEKLESQLPGLGAKLAWIESPLIEISGKIIRHRLKTGGPVKYFLPEPVYRMIKDKGLYKEF